MRRLKKQLDKALEKTLIALLGILVADVLWQVFSRYILASPSSFTDELAGFLLIWVGMLGAAYVAGQKQHLAIDLLLQKSSAEKQWQLNAIINYMIIVFALLVMVVGGSWLVITRFQLSVYSVALKIPLGIVYLVIPFSGLLFIFYALIDILNPEKK